MSLATNPTSSPHTSSQSGNGMPAATVPLGKDTPPDVPVQVLVSGRESSLHSLLFNILIPLLILLLGVVIVVALGSVQSQSRPPDDESLGGRMQRLAAADVLKVRSLEEIGKPLELRVNGVVVPYREVEIAAEVSGRIVKKSPACEAGSYVKKGDLLVEIDATDYEQEVERLTRMREQDYEGLKEVDQELANTKKMVDIAKQDVELQDREVKRLQSMPAGFASEGELDKAKKSLLMANQSAISYENQMNLLAAKRSKLEATERLATTQLHGAETNLARTKIYCPVDGVIVRENAELNSFIQRGSPIVTLDDVAKAEVAINLRMDQLLWVLDQQANDSGAAGQASAAMPSYSIPPTPAVIEYEVSGRSDKVYRWNGTLVRYDGIGLDPRSRTVPVVVVVDHPQQFEGGDAEQFRATTPSPLVRGMFVNVRLLIKPRTPLVAIPSIAIQPGNRVWQFVAEDSVLDQKKETPVETLTTKNAEGEKVVIATAQPTVAQPTVAQPTVAQPTVAQPTVAQQTVVKSEPESAKFDPALWIAGRVVIRRNVVPVDSLWLPTGDSESDADSDQRRYWICEIAGGEVSGGSWIVSSPLGDFETELPVRVPVKSLQ